MIIKPLMTFLGTRDLPDHAQGLIQRAVLIASFIDFLFGLSNTFFVLFVIDIVGYELLGVLLALGYIIQAALDYPSGVLGDWIGQKWLMFTAYLSFGLSFYILTFADSLVTLLIAYIIFAFALSQASGTFNSWVDNNYKIAVKDTDPDRKVYKYFSGKWQMISDFIMALAFVLGGILATIYQREVVFALQAIGMVIISIAALIIMFDFPEVEKSEKSVDNYFKLLFGGFKAVFMHKTMFFFVIGICFHTTLWTVWNEMILFPIYFGYTGSDGGAGLFRFIVRIAGIFMTGLAATYAAKLTTKWQPRLIVIHSILFFSSFILITSWFPITGFPNSGSLEPTAIILTFFVLVGITILIKVTRILEQRIYLDLVPDQNRNAVYSLIPTLVLLVSVPTVIISGQLLEDYGLTSTLVFLLLLGLVSTVFFFLARVFLPRGTLDPQTIERQSWKWRYIRIQ
ncbi:MAG: MFS transporter [Candidatus Hodarchaeales archaeon]|jgi:MFS family permease